MNIQTPSKSYSGTAIWQLKKLSIIYNILMYHPGTGILIK
jgi:hypothetical protein